MFNKKNVFLLLSIFSSFATYAMSDLHNKVKQELLEMEQKALQELMNAFPNVPKETWRSTLNAINITHSSILTDLSIKNADQKLPKKSFCDDRRSYNYSDMPKHIKHCLQNNGLNPEKIPVKFEQVEIAEHFAETRFGMEIKNKVIVYNYMLSFPNKNLFDLWYSLAFRNHLCLNLRTFQGLQHFHCLEKFTLLPFTHKLVIFPDQKIFDAEMCYRNEAQIEHEITHIKEGHLVKQNLITQIINSAILAEILNNAAHEVPLMNQAFLKYLKTHEYIANLFPCIENPDIAKFKFKSNMLAFEDELLFKEKYFLTTPFSAFHPRPSENAPFLKRIVDIHEQNSAYEDDNEGYVENITKKYTDLAQNSIRNQLALTAAGSTVAVGGAIKGTMKVFRHCEIL